VRHRPDSAGQREVNGRQWSYLISIGPFGLVSACPSLGWKMVLWSPNGKKGARREEGTPVSYVKDEITLRSSRAMRNLAAGRWGNGCGPPWRGSSVGNWAGTGTSACYGFPSTLSTHQCISMRWIRRHDVPTGAHLWLVLQGCGSNWTNS
jgi:hypothetical protein